MFTIALIISAVTAVYFIKIFTGIPKGRKGGLPNRGTSYDKGPYHRREYPGDHGEILQAQLPQGMTQYYFHGPQDGPKILLVHGITTPAIVFKGLAEQLAQKGFRVLSFDLYGRGYSDSPDVPYNADLFKNQIYQLTESISWSKFNLFGLSMGGGIATAFAAHFPEKVERLILAAPAGLLESLPPGTSLLKTPIFGDVLWNLVGPFFLKSMSKNGVKDPSSPIATKLKEVGIHQVAHSPAFLRSYLSTIRNFPLAGLHKAYEKVGSNEDIPVLVLWGNQDRVVPFSNSKTLLKCIPRARLVTFDGASHAFVAEESSETAKHVASFIEESSKK